MLFRDIHSNTDISIFFPMFGVLYITMSWYFVDPTWGSGYLSDGRFVKQINNFYFMTKPKDMIRSHMPFDPLWQFLYNPVTNQEFCQQGLSFQNKPAFFQFLGYFEYL